MTNAYSTQERGRRTVALMEVQARIRELYEQDLTDEEIGNRLSVHRTNITRIRNDMGLPPRWGNRNYTFTPRHDADIRDLKANTKLTWPQIALIIENRPVQVVYARHQMLLTRDARRCDAVRPEKRPCGQCGEYFITPNRRQIHYCDACHKRIESMGNSFDS